MYYSFIVLYKKRNDGFSPRLFDPSYEFFLNKYCRDLQLVYRPFVQFFHDFLIGSFNGSPILSRPRRNHIPRSIFFKVVYILANCDKREKFTGLKSLKIMTLFNLHAFCQSNQSTSRKTYSRQPLPSSRQNRLSMQGNKLDRRANLILNQKSGFAFLLKDILCRHVDFPVIFNFTNFAAFLFIQSVLLQI